MKFDKKNWFNFYIKNNIIFKNYILSYQSKKRFGWKLLLIEFCCRSIFYKFNKIGNIHTNYSNKIFYKNNFFFELYFLYIKKNLFKKKIYLKKIFIKKKNYYKLKNKYL